MMDNVPTFINDLKVSMYYCHELDQFESYTRSVVFLSESFELCVVLILGLPISYNDICSSKYSFNVHTIPINVCRIWDLLLSLDTREPCGYLLLSVT